MGPWYPGEDEEEEEPREGSSHAAPTGQVQGGHLARQEESGGAPWHPSDAGGSYDAGTKGGEPALSLGVSFLPPLNVLSLDILVPCSPTIIFIVGVIVGTSRTQCLIWSRWV